MGRAPWAGTSAEDADDAAVATAMAATEATAFAGRWFSSLSGGERDGAVWWSRADGSCSLPPPQAGQMWPSRSA